MHNYGVHLCVFNRGHNLAHPVRRILGLRENGARDMESYNSVKSQLSKSALQQWRVKIALPSLRYLNGSKWNCLVSGWRPVENWCELFFDAIVRVLSSLSKGQLTPLLLDLFVPRLHKKTINTAPRLGTASFLDNSLKTRLKLCTFVGTPCSAEFWSSSLAKKINFNAICYHSRKIAGFWMFDAIFCRRTEIGTICVIRRSVKLVFRIWLMQKTILIKNSTISAPSAFISSQTRE